jgi:flavin-dependent dehydrogenase
LTLDSQGATVTFESQGQSQTARASWLIDASGRDGVVGRKLSLPRTSMGYDKKIAVYSHFRRVFRNEGEACGHITIVRHGNGWCWSIPLDAEKTSVGLVMPLEEFKKLNGAAEQAFAWMKTSSSEMRNRLKDAEQIGGFHVTSDYSYRFHSLAGPRYLLVGDAGGFIDPIFSSGVLMAQRSAKLATGHLLRAHRRGRPLSRWTQRSYTRTVYQMMDQFGEMIRAFYINSSFEVFMNPIKVTSRTYRAVNAFIAGQPKRDFNNWACVKFFHLLCWVNRHKRIMPPLELNQINPAKV